MIEGYSSGNGGGVDAESAQRLPQLACAGGVEKRGKKRKYIIVKRRGKNPADKRLYLKVNSQM